VPKAKLAQYVYHFKRLNDQYFFLFFFFFFSRVGVSCGATPSRVGATPSAAIGYFGDNVTYVCLQTHISVGGGAGRVTCNSSGLWEDDPTDSVPLCVGELVT